MEWSIRNNTFSFIVTGSSLDSEDQKAILSSLTDNGIGEQNDNVFTIPGAGIFELSDGQRRILGLPDEYPYSIFIENDGLINRPDFKYVIHFTKKGERGRFKLKSNNSPVIEIISEDGNLFKYILPQEHYCVLQEIDMCNNGEFKDSSSNYNALARIKNLAAKDPTIVFNDYFNGYDVHPISQIKLGIDNEDGSLRISPELPDEQLKDESISKGEFACAFDRRNKVLPVYTLKSNDGTEHKVVLPDHSEPALETLKGKYRRVDDAELVRDIIDNPQAYLDEELFDLREFYSDRVIKIGLYKPQFFGFISPYKSEWIPGFTIEDKYNGNTNVFLKKPEDIEGFESSIKEAKQNGKSEIDYKGYKLELNQADEILSMAKRQNLNPRRPIIDKSGKKVLIIEENAETLGYRVDKVFLETPEQYQLHRIEGLRPNIDLKSHQVEGVAWLQHLAKSKSKGCILADDMGLGKTLQILCFIDWHNRHHNPTKKPYIIVAPVSLLNNWENEIKKFIVPDALSCKIVHGGMIDRRRNDDDIEWLKKQNIILTNYETVRSCQFNICAVDYAAAIMDEAQKIKTPGTYVTCAAKALKADFKVAMTGTPVENTFLDLWCIMDFAIPGLLGNAREFAKTYQSPLKSADTDIEELGRNLRAAMGVFFLRRQKLDVLKDLPEKTDVKREIVMAPAQVQKYISLISAGQKEIANGNHDAILTLLGNLRRVSDSPLLTENIDVENVGIHDLVASSAKIQATLEILGNIHALGEKAIIFCVFKESQRMLQRIIKYKYQITPKIINGDTKVLSTTKVRDIDVNYSRQQAIDDFEEKPGFNVIIMSPIAAGMGLNVTAANHVIHFGRHWNPAKESQATDRAYRIGQNKPVFVYYPITTLPPERNFKSFDQTLDELLNRKSKLADATLFPSEATEVQMDDFKEFLSQAL